MLRHAPPSVETVETVETAETQRWLPEQRYAAQRLIWLVDPIGAIPGEGLLPSRTWSIARALVAAGHGVVWWTSGFSHTRKIPRNPPLHIFTEEGFRVRLIAARPYRGDFSLGRFASHRDFARTFERVACESVAAGQLERPDLVLATLPPPDSAEAAERIARRLDAEFVVDVAEIWPETLQPLIPGPAWLAAAARRILFPGIRRRCRLLLGRTNAVLAGSQTTAARLSTVAPAAAVNVVPIGSYVQDYMPPRPLIDQVPPPGRNGRQPASQAAPALAVAVAGDLDDRADLLSLVDLARALSRQQTPATLHVIGGGRWMPKLISVAPLVKGSCRIVAHGMLDRSRYVARLADCQVGLVLPGLLARLPLPAVACDYAAAGLAVVLAGAGELADLVQAAEAGVVVDAADADTLAAAIAGLATATHTISRQRQAARRLAETRLDREQLASDLVTWLEALAAPAVSEAG